MQKGPLKVEQLIKPLTVEQKEPITRLNQNAVIFASAGSGKTLTLSYAIASELLKGIPPKNIVAFTFTEKAAEELYNRVHLIIRNAVPEKRITDLLISTIHSWCFNFLKQEPEYFNYDPLDELHLSSLVGRFYDHLNIESIYGKKFPYGIEYFLSDLEIFYNESIDINSTPTKIQPVIHEFLTLLNKNRLLTFGDMIRNATDLISEKYLRGLADLDCLFIDEYQDVNPAQVRLIKTMSNDTTRIVAVGDDMQCIYQWRGSDIKQIINYTSEYKDSKSFNLEFNFRSRPQIVYFANKIAENVINKAQKEMKPKRNEPESPTTFYLHSQFEVEQARNIAEIIKNFVSHGSSYSDIAILLRSVLSSGQSIVAVLQTENIPVECPVLSRSGDFINSVILPIFNWLRRKDLEARNEQEFTDLENMRESIFESIKYWSVSSPTDNDIFKSLGVWRNLIIKNESKAYNVRYCLYNFLDSVGIRNDADNHHLMLALGISTQIIRSVEEIHRRRMSDFKRQSALSIMNEIFFSLLLHIEDFGETIPLDKAQDAVFISTIHQAKGLEWPIIILPTLNRNRFPVKKRSHRTSYSDEIASRYGTVEEDEWRLFYVAVTRAQERVFLISYGKNGKSTSVFIKKLEQETTRINKKDINNSKNTIWDVKLQRNENTNKIIRLGLSDLLIYIDCPFQYGLRRMCNIQPSIGDELGYGKSLHEIIQRRIINHSKWQADELESQVDINVFLPYTSDKNEEQAKLAIKDRITLLEENGIFDLRSEPEIQIELSLYNGTVYCMIDGIYYDDDKTILREWKSNVHERLLDRYILQVQAYAVALQKNEIKLNRAEIINIGESKKQNRIISFEVDCSHNVLQEVESLIEEALKSLYEGKFEPKPSFNNCGRCDLYSLCNERIEGVESIVGNSNVW